MEPTVTRGGFTMQPERMAADARMLTTRRMGGMLRTMAETELTTVTSMALNLSREVARVISSSRTCLKVNRYILSRISACSLVATTPTDYRSAWPLFGVDSSTRRTSSLINTRYCAADISVRSEPGDAIS